RTTASAARTSVGRLTTKPSAPLGPYWQSSTTVREKFGSRSCGIARRSVGAKDAGSSMALGSLPLVALSTACRTEDPSHARRAGRIGPRPDPPRDECVDWSFATSTRSRRPWSSVPSSCFFARSASSAFVMVTKPNPRDCPVSRSMTIATDSHTPIWEKSVRRSSSVTAYARLPTKSFLDMRFALSSLLVPAAIRPRGIAHRGDRGRRVRMTLRARVAAGVGWTGSVHWLGGAPARVTTAVVARFVVPADYAIVAAAGALAGIVGVVQESGIGAAVVQHAGDGDRAATTGFVLNLAGATAALAVCLALTPWGARFFDIDPPAALALP